MKKQDKKDFPDRKNYIKLLPAAAVIAAVAVTGVQGKAGSTQKVQSESADIKDAEELTGLITTAYSYDVIFQMELLLQQKQAKLLPKRQKPESKKERQKHFRMNLRKLLRQDTGNTSTPTASVPEGGYKDGTYQGSGTGFGWHGQCSGNDFRWKNYFD